MQEEKKENSGEPEKESLSWKNLGRRKLSVLLGGIAFLILLTAGLYFYAFDRVGLHGTALVDVPKMRPEGTLRTPWKRKGSSGAAPCFGSIPASLAAERACRAGHTK